MWLGGSRENSKEVGAPGATRTRDLLLRRQTLYPLSYGCIDRTNYTTHLPQFASGYNALRISRISFVHSAVLTVSMGLPRNWEPIVLRPWVWPLQ